MNNNQPLSNKKKLYHSTLALINNPNIYGEVRKIVVEIHKLIKVDNKFNVTILNDIDYAEYAFKLIEYLPID